MTKPVYTPTPLPPGFTAVKFRGKSTGYFWDTKGEQLWSAKRKKWHPMQLHNQNHNWPFQPRADGYMISVDGPGRRFKTVHDLKKLKPTAEEQMLSFTANVKIEDYI